MGRNLFATEQPKKGRNLLAAEPEPAQEDDLLIQAGKGFHDAGASLIGFPVDAVEAIANAGIYGYNKATGSKHPALEGSFGGSKYIQDLAPAPKPTTLSGMAANIGGSLPAMIGGGASLAKNTAVAATKTGKTAQLMGGGFIEGGVFSKGENNAERGQKLLQDAGISAVAGPVLVVAGKLTKGAYSRIRNLGRASDTGALAQKAKDIKADGLSLDELANKMKALGDEAVIADVGGVNVGRLADVAYQRGGKQADEVAKMLEARQLSSIPRIEKSIKAKVGDYDNFIAKKDAVISEMKLQSSPLYDAAHAVDIPVDKKLQEALTIKGDLKPDVNKAIRWASRLAKNEGFELDAKTIANKIKPRGLDLSVEARMSRAKKMGFDTDVVYYHGSRQDIDGFDLSRNAQGEDYPSKGLYLTDSPDLAYTYSGAEGAIYPVYLKKGAAIDIDANGAGFRDIAGRSTEDIAWDYADDVSVDIVNINNVDDIGGEVLTSFKKGGGDSPYFAGSYSESKQKTDILRDRARGANVTIVFDPNNVKSTSAAFDPKQANTGNLIDELKDEAGLLNTKEIDYIKRGLDRVIEKDTSAFGKVGSVGRSVNDIKQSVLNVVDPQNPIYKEARGVYENGAKLTRALDDGLSFFRKDGDSIMDHMSKLSPNEQAMFRQGAAKSLRNKLAKSQDGANVYKRITGNRYSREQIQAIVGDANYQSMMNDLEIENTFSKTRAKFQGSQTQPRQVKNAEVFEDGAGAITDFATGNNIGLMQRVRKVLDDRTVSNDAKAADILQSLFAKGDDGASVIRSLKALEKTASEQEKKVLNRAIGLAGGASGAGSVPLYGE